MSLYSCSSFPQVSTGKPTGPHLWTAHAQLIYFIGVIFLLSCSSEGFQDLLWEGDWETWATTIKWKKCGMTVAACCTTYCEISKEWLCLFLNIQHVRHRSQLVGSCCCSPNSPNLVSLSLFTSVKLTNYMQQSHTAYYYYFTVSKHCSV